MLNLPWVLRIPGLPETCPWRSPCTAPSCSTGSTGRRSWGMCRRGTAGAWAATFSSPSKPTPWLITCGVADSFVSRPLLTDPKMCNQEPRLYHGYELMIKEYSSDEHKSLFDEPIKVSFAEKSTDHSAASSVWCRRTDRVITVTLSADRPHLPLPRTKPSCHLATSTPRVLEFRNPRSTHTPLRPSPPSSP